MKQQTIAFSSMNSDISDKFKKDGMYKKMINCRGNNLNSGHGGQVENINSNLPISSLSFGETVSFIGACQDNKRNAIIGFYRGLQTLYITSYSIATKTESFLLKSTKIDFSKRVTHAGVMDDYLFWIDGEYKLRKFNVNNASSTVDAFTESELSSDKLPPLYPPTVVASEDTEYSGNNIGNTIFQYAYSYKYKDNEQSSWSPISGSVVPYSEDDKDFPNNLHTITLKSGGSSIKKILIAARKGEDSDFLLIDTLDKEKLSIDDDVDYEYEFYNNKATIGLTQADIITNTFNPYYYFKTMDIANDNFLALGGLKDGLENTDVTLSLTYHTVGSAGRFDGFKTASEHELGVIFSDENGRTAGVTAQETIAIPSWITLKNLDNILTEGFHVELYWSISGQAPSWAKTMSIVYLGNKTMSYFIQHVAKNIYDRFEYTYIDISPLNLASQLGSTTDITAQQINIEPYTWAKGDRIRFLTNGENDLLYVEHDYEIKGYVPQKTDAAGNILYAETIYVDKFDWEGSNIGQYSKYEIYRPKKEFSDKIYYEIAHVYKVINGVIQTTSGNIVEGDIWRRSRTYDTRQLGEMSLSEDYEFSEYQASDIVLDLSAVGSVDGLQNQSDGTPFFISQDDSLLTLDGSFKLFVEWREGYAVPFPKLRIDRPGDNNNESIDIPYDIEYTTPSASDLNAATLTGTIDYTDIDMPDGSSIYFQLRVINKHRVIVKSGSSCYFNVLVQDEDDKFVDFYVEDKNYSDYFDSDEHSQGRPYTELDVINPNRLLNNIVTTGNYFADTEIDDTNKIDTAVTYIPYQHGEIEALKVVGNTLKCLTRSKEISIYMGREEYLDGAGATQTALSDAKLGRIRVPESDYGTTNPESIMINGRSMFYYDKKNECVVASNPNGQIDIGNYGYKTFLREVTSLITGATSSAVYIGYNDKNEEVLISFVYDGDSDTAVFNERDNIWTHHLEQDNGTIPIQGYAHLGSTMLEYIGKPYLHEQGIDKLNFFGDAKTATIVGVINQEPINTKILQSMSYQSTDKWYVTIESEKMDGWPLGMYTEITTNRQVSKESIYFTDVPYNIRKKDGAINKLLYAKGTPMRCRVAAFTMTNSNTSPVQLDEFSVMYINSPTQ